MSTGDEDYLFVCPACEERMEVNGSMKEALIEKGCVICSASVTEESFSHSAPSS
ncbi:MAG: hypothetical protein ABEI77_08765 [Halorientalis sp.]